MNYRILGKIVWGLAVAGAAMLVAMAVAFAHGDAAWIDVGGYLNASGIRCCGNADCGTVPDDVAWGARVGSAIEVQLANGRLAPVVVNRIYPAADGHGHSWACTTGCLFRQTGT